MKANKLFKDALNIRNDKDFIVCALNIFKFQYLHCEVYKKFVDYLNVDIKTIDTIEKIPFLPIAFFKTNTIYIGGTDPEIIFKSSGTTGLQRSVHFINKLAFYEQSFLKCFQLFFGNPNQYTILALLPSYIEQGNSSLIFMVEKLIALSGNTFSGFYLQNTIDLIKKLLELQSTQQKIILFGVTHALLDLSESIGNINRFDNLYIIETGGMKGRKKEITREEMHISLQKAFNTKNIFSEYGMTELLSQSYSLTSGVFQSPPWMKALIREINDPLNYATIGKTGGINIIDLANVFSCSFIATQDLGKRLNNFEFEVLGRFDFSDVRGCNLLI